MKVSKVTLMYDLFYMTNGRIIEKIEANKPRLILMWKRKQLQNTENYRLGLLFIKKVKL